jgi:hypothetical protein
MVPRITIPLALALTLAMSGCGGSPSSPTKQDAKVFLDGSAAVADAPLFDFGCGGSAACTVDQVCCTMVGASLTFGCVAPASCPAADKLSCDGPDECSGGTPVCCGVDVPNGTGSYPQCNPASLGTSCTTAAACKTHLGSSCTDTTKVQLCHVAADCTDATNNMCCTFASGAASLTFCIDSVTAGLGGATCH